MIESFKITSKDKTKYLFKPLLIIFFLCVVFALILKYYHSYNFIFFVKILLGTFVGQSFLFLFPISFFYNNYYKKDKNVFLKIGISREFFIYQNEDKKVEFEKKDIQKVILHLSPPLYDKRSTWLFWDDYFYSEIVTTKGVFKVSCLVIDILEEYIDIDKIERRKVYFPLINDKSTQIDLPKPLSRVDKLKNNFENKSKEELENILSNKAKYQNDVIEIVEEVLTRRL